VFAVFRTPDELEEAVLAGALQAIPGQALDELQGFLARRAVIFGLARAEDEDTRAMVAADPIHADYTRTSMDVVPLAAYFEKLGSGPLHGVGREQDGWAWLVWRAQVANGPERSDRRHAAMLLLLSPGWEQWAPRGLAGEVVRAVTWSSAELAKLRQDPADLAQRRYPPKFYETTATTAIAWRTGLYSVSTT